MKKYVTIPFNRYQELNKNTKKDTTHTELESQKRQDIKIKKSNPDTLLDFEKGVTDDTDDDYDVDFGERVVTPKTKTKNSHNLMDIKNKKEEKSNTNDSKYSHLREPLTAHPQTRREEELPPPGIPKNRKSISIISHNKRITRNRGRWITPWKTKFT